MKAFAVALAAAVAAVGPTPAAEAALELRSWPAPVPCTPCTTLQFDRLELLLPPAVVGKVLVLSRGQGSVLLVPPSGDIGAAPLLFEVPQERGFDLFRKLPFAQRESIRTVAQFYDAVGRPAGDDESLSVARTVALGEQARLYTKATRGRMHAYRIEDARGDVQVHLVIEGETFFYTLAGAVSPALYEAVLANLKLVEAP